MKNTSHALLCIPDCHLSQVIEIPYLLFPVESTGVTVGYIDVTVRLEDCQLKTSQDTIEQLTAWCLKRGKIVTSEITESNDRGPVLI